MKTKQKHILSTKPKDFETTEQRDNDFSKFESFLANHFTETLKDQNRIPKRNGDLFFKIEYTTQKVNTIDTVKIQVYVIDQRLPDILIETDQNDTKDGIQKIAEYFIPLSQKAIHEIFFETVDTALLDLELLIDFEYLHYCVIYPQTIKEYLLTHWLLHKNEQPTNLKDLEMISWLTNTTYDFETCLELKDLESKIPVSDLTFKILKDWLDIEIHECTLNAISTVYIDPTTKHNSIKSIKADEKEKDNWIVEFDGYSGQNKSYPTVIINGKSLIALSMDCIPKLFARRISELVHNHAEYLDMDVHEIICISDFYKNLSFFEMYDFTYNHRATLINELLSQDGINDLVRDYFENTGECAILDLPRVIEDLDIAYSSDILIFEQF
jgi:hypothetical protein